MPSTPASGDLTTVDVDDPCAVAAALRRTLLSVIAGQNENRIRFKDGESEEDVTYGSANVAELRKEIARQEGLCAVVKGGRPNRFCFTAG